MSKPAVLVDRDGVIVKNREDYVKSVEEMEILPGALEALATLSKRGHRVFVITNQSAIGRGLTTRAEVDRMHERLTEKLSHLRGSIDAFLVCPHTPEDRCDCRKPAPGLLYQARDRYGVELESAVVVGDAAGDIEAAHAAGCGSILVLTGVGAGLEDGSPDHVVSDLGEAVQLILASP